MVTASIFPVVLYKWLPTFTFLLIIVTRLHDNNFACGFFIKNIFISEQTSPITAPLSDIVTSEYQCIKPCHRLSPSRSTRFQSKVINKSLKGWNGVTTHTILRSVSQSDQIDVKVKLTKKKSLKKDNENPSSSKADNSTKSTKKKINEKSIVTSKKSKTVAKQPTLDIKSSKTIILSKSKAKSKTKSKNKENVKIHWVHPSDNMSVVTNAEQYINSLINETDLNNQFDIISSNLYKFSKIKFIVRGNPLPLRRHRTARGFIYNPSASAQESFKAVVVEQLYNITSLTKSISNNIINNLPNGLYITDDDDNKPTTLSYQNLQLPLFDINQQLAMTIIFRMKRPQYHFISSKAGPGRLKLNCNNTNSNNIIYPSTTSDIDNLAKFVLDSLNSILYEDDKQIISLHAIKLYDDYCPIDDDCCQGSTQICIKAINSGFELNKLITGSFDSLL